MRIPQAIAIPPTTWSPESGSERISREKTAARNGCRFAKTEARDGPTRLIPPNQSRFATTSGPTMANA